MSLGRDVHDPRLRQGQVDLAGPEQIAIPPEILLGVSELPVLACV